MLIKLIPIKPKKKKITSIKTGNRTVKIIQPRTKEPIKKGDWCFIDKNGTEIRLSKTIVNNRTE